MSSSVNTMTYEELAVAYRALNDKLAVEMVDGEFLPRILADFHFSMERVISRSRKLLENKTLSPGRLRQIDDTLEKISSFADTLVTGQTLMNGEEYQKKLQALQRKIPERNARRRFKGKNRLPPEIPVEKPPPSVYPYFSGKRPRFMLQSASAETKDDDDDDENNSEDDEPSEHTAQIEAVPYRFDIRDMLSENTPNY